MEKPDVIWELEREIGAEFKRVGIEKINSFNEKRIAEYSVDKNNAIIGLKINGFGITEIPSAISKIQSLTVLNLNNNRIHDITVLSQLKSAMSLKQLILNVNRIEDISPIKDLKNLFILLLGWNKINDISVLHELEGITFLALTGNPVLEKPINSIRIDNFFSIENIELNNLANKNEIYFLGENGVGKTILLQAILLCIVRANTHEKIIKLLNENISFINQPKNREKKIAFVQHINNEKNQNDKISLKIIAQNAGGVIYKHPYSDEKKTNIFAYGVNRYRSSGLRNDIYGFSSLFDNETHFTGPDEFLKEIDRLEIKGIGFIKLEHVKNLLTQVINVENNIDELEIIENKADAEFYFKERGTELKFEQLSDGFKSALTWLCDLLSRLIKDQPHVTKIEDFKAIVLVDEIDLLLHPRWAYKLVRRLRVLFPNIQWFISTHSPIITLGASDDAVFYKLYKENGETKITRPFNKISGFTANSLLTSNLWLLPEIITQNTKLREINDDDYVYKLIHDRIYERLKNSPAMQEDEILQLIDLELDKIAGSHEEN